MGRVSLARYDRIVPLTRAVHQRGQFVDARDRAGRDRVSAVDPADDVPLWGPLACDEVRKGSGEDQVRIMSIR